MNSYLIAIDLDGTLKNNKGLISKNTKDILNKLKKNNTIVICTGRPRYHTEDMNSNLLLSNYIISSNGSEVFDVSKQKVLYAEYIDHKYIKNIYEDALKENIRVLFVIDDTEYVTEFTTNNSQVLIDDINKIVGLNVKQIMFFGNDRIRIDIFKDYITNKYDVSVIDSSFKKEYSWFCINHKNCNKGNAIKFLSEYLNISKDNIIAIGNDNNDISMIKYAKIGVAVKNSTEELIKNADYITESNDDEGVYIFLKKWSDKK